MKDLQESKKIYDSIEIPKELTQVVNDSIQKMELKRRGADSLSADKNMDGQVKVTAFQYGKSKRTGRKVIRRSLSAAAALLVCFIIGLNSNQAFAGQMSELPIIGVVARVLTVRSFEENNEETGINVAVEIPAVEAEWITGQAPGSLESSGIEEEGNSDATNGQSLQPSLAIDVNAEIQNIVDKHMAKSEADFFAFKESFFASGGTEEEWAGRTMDVYVNYEIKYQDESRVSFVLYLIEAWSASEEQRHYYNLELAQNRKITLEELLGPDYVTIANESILAQMEERMAENEDYVYWGSERDDEGMDMGGFTTVDENTAFYINEKGNPVISFPEYEIAPGFMGIQEFEISK